MKDNEIKLEYVLPADIEKRSFEIIAGELQEKKIARDVIAIARPVVLAAALLVVTAFLVDGSFNPFLYFRF